MASGIFAVLDDIAAIMDDVAMMSKVAARKTAGILGDDLAVNAEKASGFASSRELPVLWAISKGSLLNKVVILPIAFLLTAFLPVAITVILILGGIYLAYEGAEKIFHFFFPDKLDVPSKFKEGITETEILEIEKGRVKAAIVTDFILSIEIVIIALGSVVGKPLLSQIIVVSFIALLATVGVYGIVALIVRMDEAGYKLIESSKKKKGFIVWFGNLLVNALPYVIRALSVIGTIALIFVSGGIFVHNLDFFHNLFPSWPSLLLEFTVGLIIGFIALFIVLGAKWVWKKFRS
ncbi:DUF808 domain-containing protein [Aequorivita sp. H23M31]|uniref:DUF808 domain-containing protein n=1 Tax=Aequorivita ciconiae TaxID=2494375 RepID=A0A410G2L2_9FLAO|nr:DUF808 domain-containing protein [Aequorivita sp. H23M31]QAA81490.1 DUF808 domain-containing protein [Aequorivita sp. H23M31]